MADDLVLLLAEQAGEAELLSGLQEAELGAALSHQVEPVLHRQAGQQHCGSLSSGHSTLHTYVVPPPNNEVDPDLLILL